METWHNTGQERKKKVNGTAYLYITISRVLDKKVDVLVNFLETIFATLANGLLEVYWRIPPEFANNVFSVRQNL